MPFFLFISKEDKALVLFFFRVWILFGFHFTFLFTGGCFWILDLIWFSFHLSFTAGVFRYWIWFGFHFTFLLWAGVFGYWIWFGFHFTFLLRQVFLDIGSDLVFISPFFYGRCFWILDLVWFSFHLSFKAGVFGFGLVWFGFKKDKSL